MPCYRVELLEEAEADARQVYVWIYENSPMSAERFAEALDEAIAELGEDAHIAERIEALEDDPHREHPANDWDEATALLWWSDHPLLFQSEHPCDAIWDAVDPEFLQAAANDDGAESMTHRLNFLLPRAARRGSDSALPRGPRPPLRRSA